MVISLRSSSSALLAHVLGRETMSRSGSDRCCKVEELIEEALDELKLIAKIINKNVVNVCSTEGTVDRIEEIKDRYGDNDGEVHNFIEDHEATISEVDADDVTLGHEFENTSNNATQSNKDLNIVVGYGSDDIEGVPVLNFC